MIPLTNILSHALHIRQAIGISIMLEQIVELLFTPP
jgi:hypothetical protein